MARPKKTTRAKKPVAKKTTARGNVKLHTLNKDQLSEHIKAQTAEIKMLKSTGERRPPNNPDMPQTIIDNLNAEFNSIKELLDNFSQHLRALDRMRLNGVGIKKLGFIERAYELALENGEFLPHYLTLERFGTDLQYFLDFRTLVDLVTQIREKLWNVTIQSADICRKARGFSAWSFAKHKPLQKSIVSHQIKKTIKTTISPLAKLQLSGVAG
jgi:hypothetical protein